MYFALINPLIEVYALLIAQQDRDLRPLLLFICLSLDLYIFIYCVLEKYVEMFIDIFNS